MPSSPEELLEQLALTPEYTFPEVVLTEMVSRLDEMVPALLEELDLSLEAPETYIAHPGAWLRLTFAAFLLAQAREPRAFKPLLAHLALPDDETDLLWGNMITDGLGRILASVYDGDDAPLRALIENRGADEFARGSAPIQCYEALFAAGRISGVELEGFYRELLESKLEREPAFVWDSVCSSCSDLGFAGLLPLIKSAFDLGFCDPMYDRYEDIAERIKGPSERLAGPRVAIVTDTIAETRNWHCFKPKPVYSGESKRGPRLLKAEQEHYEYKTTRPSDPIVRESSKIGRNDPCPCGSGKKYKKCCG